MGELMETERIYLCPAKGRFGCQVPKGVWHTVEVIEPSVIYEAKDGKYGEDAPPLVISTKRSAWSARLRRLLPKGRKKSHK